MSGSARRSQQQPDHPEAQPQSSGSVPSQESPAGEPLRRPSPERHPEGRIMALDVGGRRIGVAVSDETHSIATPLQFVERGPRAIAEIQRLMEQWNIGRLIIGMPTGLSGREGPQAAAVREFAAELEHQVSVPIEYWDERLTTAIAERSLIETGHRREARRSKVDAVAAAVILQGYLDRQRLRRRR